MLQLIPGYGPQRDAAIGGNGRQLQLVARGALPRHLPNWVSVLATPWCGAVQRLAAACRHSRAGLGQSNELQAQVGGSSSNSEGSTGNYASLAS